MGAFWTIFRARPVGTGLGAKFGRIPAKNQMKIIMLILGFRPVCCRTWPRDPFQRVGLEQWCRTHPKFAPETHSKAGPSSFLVMTITWPYRDLSNSQYPGLGLASCPRPAGQAPKTAPKLAPKLHGLCCDDSLQGAGRGTTRAPFRCPGKTAPKLPQTDGLFLQS